MYVLSSRAMGKFDPPLDKVIEAAVIALQAGGVETFESLSGRGRSRVRAAYGTIPR